MFVQFGQAEEANPPGQKSEGSPLNVIQPLPDPETFFESLIAKYEEGHVQEVLQELEAYLPQFLTASDKNIAGPTPPLLESPQQTRETPKPRYGKRKQRRVHGKALRQMEALQKASLQNLTSKSPSDASLQQNPDLVWKARLLFLGGYIYLQQGIFPESSETWTRLAHLAPSFVLSDYVQYYLGESYRKQELYVEALKAYQTVIDDYPSSLLQSESRFKIARVLELQKKYAEAVTAYTSFSGKFPQHPLASRALWDAGRILEEQGDHKATLEVYRKLQRSYPYSYWAAQAYKHEQEICEKHPELEAEWDAQELYAEAERFYNLSLFSQARDVLNRILKRFPESLILEKTFLLLGKTKYNLRDNEAALKAFDDFLTRYPQNEEVPRVLNLIARLYLRLGNGKNFLSTYQKLSEIYPDNQWTWDTFYLLGTYYEEDLQNIKKALETYYDFLRKSPSGPRVEDVLWRIAWISYRSGDYQKARGTLLELLDKYPDSYYFEEALYWAGRASEKLKDWQKAVGFFQRIQHAVPRSYYGFQSSNRLKALFKDHSELNHLKFKGLNTRLRSGSKFEIWNLEAKRRGPKSSLSDSKLNRFQELKRLTLYKEAAQELEKVLDLPDDIKKASPSPEVYQLLDIYYRVRDYKKSIRLTKRYFWDWLSRDNGFAPEHFWKMAYPLGYESLIRRYTTHHIDPFLIYSIILAESEFDPDIRSPAAAIGLMQLIYETANRLAQNIGITSFSEEMLLNVELNIALGVSYVEELLPRFKGDVMPIVASYNAGEDRVETWLRRVPKEDPDAFIASIPYRETRKYVQRVLWYREEYRRIYKEQQVP
jgi:soluble lytic murein transglycosylase